MADGIEVTLEGIDDMARRLRDVPIALRKKVLLRALRKGAQIISRDAKAGAPVLKRPAPFRKPGTVKKAISVRTSKVARKSGDVGVFVGVKPLRGARQKKLGKAGAKNPNDPYYWRFLEFDTRRGPGKKFLTHAASNKASAALDAAIAEVATAIEKMDRR
ncbi:MAG: HK97 gp10 family phage protein [Rhodocyclaceae bacterium]|nr:HK97 gp10 family phage protein [Rhodocyclaceae bacterium]